MKNSSAYTSLLVNDFKNSFLFSKDVMEFDVTVDNEEGGYAECDVLPSLLSTARKGLLNIAIDRFPVSLGITYHNYLRNYDSSTIPSTGNLFIVLRDAPPQT